MSRYVVLTNRKRAIIALIHSVVFLFIALRGLAVPAGTEGLIRALHTHAGLGASATITGAFLVVTTVLVILWRVSGCIRERLYFAFCACSAGTGFLRALVGDPPLHAAQYIRALMLVSAVAVGTVIWRGYSIAQLSSE